MNCKTPITNEDLKNAICYQWDAYYNKNFLDIYYIPGFPHSYCCPRGEKLRISNIMNFSGKSCKWDFKIKSNNYYKNKRDRSIEHNYLLIIYRNEKLFYKLKSYNMNYLIARAQILLIEISEHPIGFHFINYEKEIIGRKIYFKNIPCIIKRYSEGDNLEIEPINKKEDDEVIMEDLFSHSINWFRD